MSAIVIDLVLSKLVCVSVLQKRFHMYLVT